MHQNVILYGFTDIFQILCELIIPMTIPPNRLPES